MRLFLSSEGFSARPEKLAELVGEQNRSALIIANAVDYKGEDYKEGYIAAQKEQLLALGFTAETLDLREYFETKNGNGLAGRIAIAGLIWVLGGNTYNLRRAMYFSGFDEAAVPLIKENQVVYGGFSAGAVAATHDIGYIRPMDNPDTLPEGYPKKEVTSGLGLYPLPIIPHLGSEKYHNAATDCVEGFRAVNQPYQPLPDGSALVLNNGRQTYIPSEKNENTGD